ncbi:disks large-associated protein 5 [Scophthalmus maximus]|uniref:disks large-associated protein 5 n=1 Tax=Scophthalmus maximus TaxID=52904 RepID=UPI001FA82FAD|nr:disks large-associated protein 5 [Scophthalmus maximus]XP_047183655.1 disks large-associated protein 5 [Scophthalmus maximus]
MESRFAHLRQRDTSVSMLRVKLSRRRSQSQKENRDRAVNTRRQLDKVPEMDISSLDASIAMANMSTIKERTQNNAKSMAVEERLKQLERWKERKALEKEKEKREKERKGVFKVGLYHHTDTRATVVSAAPKRAKETKVNTALSLSTRVTRSMKQPQQPLKKQDPNTVAKKAQPAVERSLRTRVAPVKPAPATISTKTKVCAVEPTVRTLSTRSANRPPVTTVPAVKDKPKDKAAVARTTRSRAIADSVGPPSGKERNCKATVNDTTQPPFPKEPELKEPQEILHPSSSEEEEMVVDPEASDSVPAVDPVEAPPLSSFAPKGFVFQAPVGLLSLKFQPLTPRSADAFLTPSSSFNVPPVPLFNFNDDPQAEPSELSPPKSPHGSPPHTSPTVAPPPTGSPMESNHDVPYFRSEISSETDQLTTLSFHWESKVEDESIPEEMRDRMRTAVGQARLLMKQRFNQFSGLVDDCELGRGEKITTCTDLQGFWDMVYYQVEDVKKKFDALKEAEGRDWVEEHKPQPRQRKALKKPSTVTAKPTGTKAASKSRLAAVKAAMKARQQAAEAEKAATDAGKSEEDKDGPNCHDPQPQAESQIPDTVVFDGGFFQVESPAKQASVRRSSRLSAAVQSQASPCSKYLTPRRATRRSHALAQTPTQTVASPTQPILTPALMRLTLDQTPKSRHGTPQSSQGRKDTVNVSLCFSPVKIVLPDDTQSEGSPAQQAETVPTQEKPASVPEPSTDLPIHSLPSISAVEEPDEDVDDVLPVSPRLSPSPCKMPPPVSQAPEPSSSLSFTLSPCASPIPSPPPAGQGHMEAQESVCCTPDTSVVEEIPGLDFERYLLPSQRCSLSPRETVARETLSPMAVDIEMESPRGQSEDLLTQQEPALPAVPSLLTLQSPQVQSPAAESGLLLFTPDLKDRIRQSVCPSDLMVFTPPSNM